MLELLKECGILEEEDYHPSLLFQCGTSNKCIYKGRTHNILFYFSNVDFQQVFLTTTLVPLWKKKKNDVNNVFTYK